MNNVHPTFNGLFDSIADLSRPTHKITAVEAVDFAQLAKDQSIIEMEENLRKLRVIATNLQILFEENSQNTRSLFAIAAIYKETDFNELCGITLDYIDRKFPQGFHNFINSQTPPTL